MSSMNIFKKIILTKNSSNDEEPFQELWSFIEFNLTSKYTKWLRLTSALNVISFVGFLAIAFKLCPQLDFKVCSIPFFMLPMMPSNLLLSMNYFSFVLPEREALFMELRNMKQIRDLKNNQDAKNYKRTWCIISIFLTLYVSVGLFLFHPALVNTETWEIYKFDERPSYYRFLVCAVTSVGFLILAYTQWFTVCAVIYMVSVQPILLYKLRDYIVKNLCKNYESMTIVDCEPEQNAIAAHLELCARFELLLRSTLSRHQNRQNFIIILYCPLITLSSVVGLICIFGNIHREFKIYYTISCYVVIVITLCHLSEQTSAAFASIHDKLCASNWPYWNIKNKKLLLIILPNTERRVEISFAGWISLNYQFFLKGVKLCYSLVTMVLNITY